MSDFVTADALLAKIEGGFTAKDNNAGAANYGITEKWFRAAIDPNATAETIRKLTPERARDIRRIYWWPPWSRIDDDRLSQALYITAFNIGPVPAIKILQRALNNRLFIIESPTPELSEDGKLGPKTYAAIEEADQAGHSSWIVDKFKQDLLSYYEELAKQNAANAKYLPGWKNRVAKL